MDGFIVLAETMRLKNPTVKAMEKLAKEATTICDDFYENVQTRLAGLDEAHTTERQHLIFLYRFIERANQKGTNISAMLNKHEINISDREKTDRGIERMRKVSKELKRDANFLTRCKKRTRTHPTEGTQFQSFCDKVYIQCNKSTDLKECVSISDNMQLLDTKHTEANIKQQFAVSSSRFYPDVTKGSSKTHLSVDNYATKLMPDMDEAHQPNNDAASHITSSTYTCSC